MQRDDLVLASFVGWHPSLPKSLCRPCLAGHVKGMRVPAKFYGEPRVGCLMLCCPPSCL